MLTHHHIMALYTLQAHSSQQPEAVPRAAPTSGQGGVDSLLKNLRALQSSRMERCSVCRFAPCGSLGQS